MAYRGASVLLTVAGSHAIYIYQQGLVTQVLGSATERGCLDGPLNSLRFWFPSSSEPLSVNDSRPLLPGPDVDVIYVHSGGVLMELGHEAAKKVTSLREELWMTEKDEGTPEFPLAYGVLGVYDNKAGA